MRDFMTGEDITDQPERWMHLPEETMLGRWAGRQVQQSMPDPWAPLTAEKERTDER